MELADAYETLRLACARAANATDLTRPCRAYLRSDLICRELALFADNVPEAIARGQLPLMRSWYDHIRATLAQLTRVEHDPAKPLRDYAPRWNGSPIALALATFADNAMASARPH